MAPRLAEHAAERLLESLGITQPPVPVEDIAHRLGIVVMRDAMRDVSGMLLRDSGPSVIAVNSSHSPRRQRFTIAHELGHFQLHRGVFVDPDTRINLRSSRASSGVDREEIQANAFAAALLMPDRMVMQAAVAQRTPSAGQMSADLAQIFDVSEQAMDIRLSVLGILTPF